MFGSTKSLEECRRLNVHKQNVISGWGCVDGVVCAVKHARAISAATQASVTAAQDPQRKHLTHRHCPHSHPTTRRPRCPVRAHLGALENVFLRLSLHLEFIRVGHGMGRKDSHQVSLCFRYTGIS